MAKKSLKLNFIYNLIYQLLVIITPFIVTPYISRVLGVDNVGLYSYSNSIVSYFLLFAILGTTTYAQRSIGYVQADKEARSRKFWEIYIFRLATVGVTLGAYMLFVMLGTAPEQRIIYLILSLNLVNVIIDISWFMLSIEEFGKTVSFSILFRALNIAFIFLFVKGEGDLWIYVLLTVAFTVGGNLPLWLFLPKYICKVKGIKPFKDIKTVLQMFLPTIAVQIYTVLDKSMIGWFTEGYSENGYYEQAEKVVKITLTLVTSLGLVMIPRISQKFKEGNLAQVYSYLYKSYRFVWMMSIPIMFGLIVIADTFVPIFFGDGYEPCILLIQIFSPIVIAIGLSNVTGMQYFVPTGKQNILTLTVVIGAGVNFVLNLCLIPFFHALGASIASVVAEFTVCVAGFIYCLKQKKFNIKPIFTCSWKYWLAGAVMFVALYLLKMALTVKVWCLLVLFFSGVVLYFVLLLVLRDNLFWEILRTGFGMIGKIFRRKSKAVTAGAPSENNTATADAPSENNTETSPLSEIEKRGDSVPSENNTQEE